jgi:hypothetical protein
LLVVEAGVLQQLVAMDHPHQVLGLAVLVLRHQSLEHL